MSRSRCGLEDRAADSGQGITDRRRFLAASAAALTTTAWAAGTAARAQTPPDGTTTTRQYGPHAEPTRFPDPDIVVLEKRFAKIKIGNTPIRRLHTGMLWAEGPGLERRRQVPRLVRHPQRRPAPLARG